MMPEEAIERGIDLKPLKEEQIKLAKLVKLKDSFDFSLAEKIAGIVLEPSGKTMLASIVVLDKEFKIIERKFATQRARFPYITGFRAYRELPIMLEAYEKLENSPDVIFILGNGISHPRGLGLASHLSININKPVIGIVNYMNFGEEKENKIYSGSKIVAEKIQTRQGSKPIYVSPGNLISLKTAVELTKKFIREPHKMPEPIVEARKFAKEVKEELGE